jgi:hypothetical protein
MDRPGLVGVMPAPPLDILIPAMPSYQAPRVKIKAEFSVEFSVDGSSSHTETTSTTTRLLVMGSSGR